MRWVDGLSIVWIVGSVTFIFWRTHEYLKPPRIGKRPSFSMVVRDGRIHFRSRP